MSKSCDLFINKRSRVGNRVSHSNIKTKRVFHVNLQSVSFFSKILNKSFNFKVSTRLMRTVNKYGGFDGFFMSIKSNRLTDLARGIRSSILSKSKQVQ